MAEQPKPCPHCQGTDLKILPRNHLDGGGFVLTCQNSDCIARIWGHDEADVVARWNRRTPGPATKAMLTWAKKTEESLEGHDASHPLLQIFRAFLAESPDPATPPAPGVPPMKPLPWKCSRCGEPVRISDDLLVFHCLDTVHGHDAELSDADLKTLADGLRLTD